MNTIVRTALAVLVLSSATSATAQEMGHRVAGEMGHRVAGEKGAGMMSRHVVRAGPSLGPPSFLSRVFPPKLVMQHQQELGLTPAQVDAIKKAMGETQQKLIDLQWKLDAESELLDKLLSADQIDETAALAKLEVVTGTEQRVKNLNFALLLRIRNVLDPQQQTRLRELRPAMGAGTVQMFEYGGPGGPGPMFEERVPPPMPDELP